VLVRLNDVLIARLLTELWFRHIGLEVHPTDSCGYHEGKVVTGTICSLRFIAFLGLAVWTAAGMAEPRKVEWSLKLRLKDRAAISSRLSEPFDGTISVVKEGHRASVSNCNEYLKLSALGFAPAVDRDTRLLQSWGLDCQALQALRGALPARVSWLKDFNLDAEAPGYLPPDLAASVSSEDTRKAHDAAARHLSWRQYQSGLTATPAPDGLSVVADGTNTRLEIYARGDFNRDGLEDILIRTTVTFNAASYTDSRLFLLTRDRQRARLRVLREYQ
jgi:hypothetical protein